jgi:single-strand DNA-binding protein
MASLNKVCLIGTLGRDPEVRNTQSGRVIVNMSLATSEKWRDKESGEMKERTEWHRVVIFNEKIGEIVEKYVKKGSKIYIEGALRTRKWTDDKGVEKYSTEVTIEQFNGQVILLGDSQRGGDGERSPSSGSHQDAQPRGAQRSPNGRQWDAGADLDDEIPF